MTHTTTPARNARKWAAMNALTHHTGRAVNAREFEAIAPADRAVVAMIMGRANACESDAGRTLASDAK
jgi:hypothetical protein